MSEFSLRSFVLNGNLSKDASLLYKFANNECESGIWKLAIKSVYYKINESRALSYAHICCNLVRDFRFPSNSSIKENFFPTISSLLFEGIQSSESNFRQNEIFYLCINVQS